MKSRKYLLSRGFFETKAEIIAVEKKEILGTPRKPTQHIVEFILTVKVPNPSDLPFNAIITTHINDEKNNMSNQIIKRDYKVGEEILVLYHPQTHKVEYLQ